MAERKAPKVNRGRVQRVERVTPHMIRVVVGEVGGFAAEEFTDHYVKLMFPVEGVAYPEPFDMQVVRETMPREHQPRLRTYTVRSWDPAASELVIDFVHHGDKGLAGPWAAKARPGDEVMFLGPGGGYAPDAEANWHLLVGDESALPAIAASLERLPAGATAKVFVEVSGPDEEQKLETSGDAEIVYLHRNGGGYGETLVEAVRALDFPDGTVHAFVHGEAGFVKQLRRHLRIEREIPLDRLSISGYWRTGVDDEGWRKVKRDWNQAIEAEEAAATHVTG